MTPVAIRPAEREKAGFGPRREFSIRGTRASGERNPVERECAAPGIPGVEFGMDDAGSS